MFFELLPICYYLLILLIMKSKITAPKKAVISEPMNPPPKPTPIIPKRKPPRIAPPIPTTRLWI